MRIDAGVAATLWRATPCARSRMSRLPRASGLPQHRTQSRRRFRAPCERRAACYDRAEDVYHGSAPGAASTRASHDVRGVGGHGRGRTRRVGGRPARGGGSAGSDSRARGDLAKPGPAELAWCICIPRPGDHPREDWCAFRRTSWCKSSLHPRETSGATVSRRWTSTRRSVLPGTGSSIRACCRWRSSSSRAGGTRVPRGQPRDGSRRPRLPRPATRPR